MGHVCVATEIFAFYCTHVPRRKEKHMREYRTLALDAREDAGDLFSGPELTLVCPRGTEGCGKTDSGCDLGASRCPMMRDEGPPLCAAVLRYRVTTVAAAAGCLTDAGKPGPPLELPARARHRAPWRSE